MRTVKCLLLLMVLSGCYQSRVVDRDFEEMVDYMTIRYGVDMRNPGPQYYKILGMRGNKPISLEQDPRRNAVQLIQDGGLIDGRSSFLSFPRYIKVRQYVPGKQLSFQTYMRFIGTHKSKVQLGAIDQKTRVDVDQYHRFIICCSMMRAEERKWLAELDEDLEQNQVDAEFYKTRSHIVPNIFNPFEDSQAINLNHEFCEMIKQHDRDLYQRFLDRFSQDPNKAIGLQGLVAAIQRDGHGAQAHVTLTIGSEEGLALGDELFLYRDKTYIVKVMVSAVESDRSLCTVLPKTWNTSGKAIQITDFAQSDVFQYKAE